MRRIVLFVLALMTVCPVISQDSIRIRGCRPGLENRERAHTAHRVSAIKGTRRTSENPYIGDRRQLVVLASFADKGFKGDSVQTLAQWDKILNTRHLTDSLLCGSLYDYFYDQSYGQLSLSFDLYYLTVDSAKKYHSTSRDDENSKYLVQDVSKLLDARIDDWAQYDWDSDGYVDQLLIIYAGKGQQDGGGNNSIWAHQWWMSEHIDVSPVKVQGADKEYLIDKYCCVQELSGKDNYGSFGTLCHEYTHCFGLPDFYYEYKTVGAWDLMDCGNYNGDGFTPCGYSAFERAFMGWMTPEELTDMQCVEGLPALSAQPKAYMVRSEGNPDEYYIIENRQQTGWDEKLPGSGIVIFHVDYDDYIFHDGFPNTKNEKRYTIFPANDEPYPSNENVKGWAYPYNGNDSLTNKSKPAAELNHLNSDSTLYMNKPITEMAVAGGLARFKFCYPVSTGIGPVRKESATDGGWFTIDAGRGLYIRDGKVVWIR